MKQLEIDKEVIEERLDKIQQSLRRLEEFKHLTQDKFMLGDNFAIAEHYLRYALEAIFDICGHILARIPGAQVDEYKKMATEMAKQNLIPKKFAEEILVKMAGYRNRLTHFYFEITPQEMYEIARKNLGDFETFMMYIKKILD